MDTCNCHPHPSAKAGLALAIATIPLQTWETLYDPACALREGTVFPSLNLPFYVTAAEKSLADAAKAARFPAKGGGSHG